MKNAIQNQMRIVGHLLELAQAETKAIRIEAQTFDMSKPATVRRYVETFAINGLR